MRPTIFAAVVALFGTCADAADLFVPIATSSEPNGTVSGGTKERLVRIARNELANVRDSVASRGTGRLLVSVDDDLELRVVVERTSPTRWGYSLSGRVDNPTMGFVTLVVHDKVVAGTIWTPDASYEIVHFGGGVHAVREVAYDAHQCRGSVAAGTQTFVQPANASAKDPDAVVDVLVVWTPRREETAGGVDAVRAGIELGIAYTNDAFERSGAFVALNLVGAEPVPDYEPANDRSDLHRLADPSDGHMDAVHQRRDAVGADLVNLAKSHSTGIAFVPGAFSVSGPHPQTVAHEFGHNFGLLHERSQWRGFGDARTGPAHYQHGYVISRDLSCTSTIMAYGEQCPRSKLTSIPFFSSPASFDPLDGSPIGVSVFSDRRRGGVGAPADAVLHLNRARHAIADFKPRRSTRTD